MTEHTTLPGVPVSKAPELAVTIEDDASPVVRLIGRTLRDFVRAGHAVDVLRRSAGTVAIRSHDTPQSATMTLGGESINVSGGVFADPDATLVVDLNSRFAPVQEPTGDGELAMTALRALTPPLPHWSEAAQRFWDTTRDIPGIPDVLVVVADEPDRRDRARFGEGPTEYVIAGTDDLLTRVLTGADDFVASLSAGLRVKGTLAQMSVMTAAFWKVRYDA